MIELNKIYNEECLEGMKKIPDGSIDMILCDLPYGTTVCKWDTIIPFEPLAVLQKKQKKSFVIVADIDFDEVSEEIIVVPTLQEGFDIIVMVEIERDLGF